MSIRRTGNIFLAFIIGGAVGAGLGILFAPVSGKETRKKIAGIEDDLVSKAEGLLSDGKAKLLEQKHHIEETVRVAGKEIKNAGKYIENIYK